MFRDIVVDVNNSYILENGSILYKIRFNFILNYFEIDL